MTQFLLERNKEIYKPETADKNFQIFLDVFDVACQTYGPRQTSYYKNDIKSKVKGLIGTQSPAQSRRNRLQFTGQSQRSSSVRSAHQHERLQPKDNNRLNQTLNSVGRSELSGGVAQIKSDISPVLR